MNSQISMSSIEDMLLEIAWKNYDFNFESKRDLDNKTNMILVANGVLLGLIFNGLEKLQFHLGLISVVLIVLSAIWCVQVLRLEPYKTVDVLKTWHALKEREILDKPIPAKKNMFATVDKAVKENMEKYSILVKDYRYAISFFRFALIFLGFAILIPIIAPYITLF